MATIKNLASARSSIWRLIKFRLRSEKEIRDRLTFKGYESQIVEQAISYFKELGFINDKEFSRSWMESRLNKPLGLMAIRGELAKKGVAQEIIEELFSQKSKELDERFIVQSLALKHLNQLKENNAPPERIKPRLYAYLIRRGFSSEVVSEILLQIMSNTV